MMTTRKSFRGRGNVETRGGFMSAISNDLNIANKFIKLVTNDAEGHEERLLNLAYNSLRKRVVRGLVAIQETVNKDKNADH